MGVNRYLLIALGATVLMSAAAKADVITIGDPIPGNSWKQAFNETGVGPFTKMQLQMVSADAFKAPVFDTLASGWTTTPLTGLPTVAVAQGPAVTNMTFRIQFDLAPSNPLSFDFFAFNGTALLESANASWSGSTWTIVPTNRTPIDTNSAAPVVPTPQAAMAGLGLLGALGMMGYLRQRRNRHDA